MGIFDKKTKEIIPIQDGHKEDLETMDWFELNKKRDEIETAIEKALDLNQFQMPSDYFGEQGNYFGQEFNLQATVGRLKSLYAKEPWVFATASLIARTLSYIPFRVRDPRTEEWIDNHPINDLIRAGNTVQDDKSMNWAGYVDLILGGNFIKAFDEKYTTPFHIPVEYANLKLRRIETLTDRKELEKIGPIESVDVSPGFVGAWGKKESIPYEQIVHHKFPNPFNPFYGMSLYTAASRPILLDRNQNEFSMAFYLRGATNAGVIETTEDMTKTRMERLMRTFEQAFTGKRNWWRTLFLPKGAKWINSGLTMNEMQHLETLRENRRTLLAVLGIPPSKVGIVEDVNRATSEVQDETFYNNTIVPLAWFIAAGWNNSYLMRVIYGGKVEVAPDFTGIPAIEGSWTRKGEQITAVKEILTINELRQDILGYPPLKETDPRGNKFVAEIGPAFTNPFGSDSGESEEDLLGSEDVEESSEEDIEKVEDGEIEGKAAKTEKIKIETSESQNRIERRQGDKFVNAFSKYIDLLLKQTKDALSKHVDIRANLTNGVSARLALYEKAALPILSDTQEQGFVLGKQSAKSFTGLISKKQFTDTDEQAIEVLRERTREGQRRTLFERAIEAFYGFDKTRTEIIMDLIADGLKQGETTEGIAKTIAKKYLENYSDQAFTIARTETLHAVSQGLMWNQNVLSKVFSEVHKQWFHVGDVATNPQAREGHAELEDVGEVPASYVWVNQYTGARLRYPRDYEAGAGDVINCRCSMANVIPDHATSNSQMILETE